MKTNKYLLTITVAGILTLDALCAGAGENSFELVAGYRWLSPEKDMDWQSASGIEIQGQFWQSEHVGLALVAASDTWKVKAVTTEEETADTYTYTSTSGDASMTSFGVSLCYREQTAPTMRFIMDLGLRYASVDSSVYGEAAYDGPGGANYFNEKIDIENTMLFVIGAGLECQASKNVWIGGNIGYQVDLKKPQEIFAGESLGETGFDAVSVGLFVSCSF